jgi:hypothetical protein
MPFGITATLGLDGRGFKAGMKEAQGITTKWTAGLKGQIAAAFTAAAVVRATKDVVNFASKVDDFSKKMGISRTAVQEWMYALKLSGGEIEDLARSFKALGESRLDVLGKGDKEKQSIFEALGITKESLQNNPLETTMKQIARAFETMDFGAAEGGMISKILGKGGIELLATFKEGIDDAIEDLHEMGGVIEDEVVRNLDAAGDAADTLGTKLRVVAADALHPLLKLTRFLLDQFNDIRDSIAASYAGMQLATETGENWVEHTREIRAAMDADVATKRIKREERAAKRGEGREKRDPWVPPRDVKEAKAVDAGMTPSSDSLARIGGFVGGGGGTVNRLTSIERELKELNKQVKSGLVLKPE